MHKRRQNLNAVLTELPLPRGLGTLPEGASRRRVNRACPSEAAGTPGAKHTGASYSVVIGGIWVLVTGDDLRSHPVGGAYERVSPPHSPVQLSAHSEIDWKRRKKENGNHN